MYRKKPEFWRFFHVFFDPKIFSKILKMTHIGRDRHAFSELDIFMGKTPQKRFRIEICAIKNPIVKNRIKNGFSYQKIVLEKEAK